MWRIKNFAKLYGVSAHTLRFYEEVGLLIPDRSDNNYRIYHEKHLEQLNIIRDLRNFHIPIEQIKEYLEQRTVDQTKHLMQMQNHFINQQIKELQDKQKRLQERIQIFEAIKDIKEGEIKEEELPERYVIPSEAKDIESSHVDISLKELSLQHELDSPYLDQNMFGSFLSLLQNEDGLKIHHQVFYFVDKEDSSEAIKLPSGTYLTTCYRGSYSKAKHHLHIMRSYIEKHNYEMIGNFIEINLIDFHETSSVEEYFTKIEVRVKSNDSGCISEERWLSAYH